MNIKNHPKNKGSFKAGQVDKRRNDKGQTKKETVALGALLKQYITDEGNKASGQGKQTKAEALAAKIWDQALKGNFQFVQFLSERIMGKVKDEISIDHENSVYRFEYDTEPPKMEIRVVHVDDEGKELYTEKPAMQP